MGVAGEETGENILYPKNPWDVGRGAKNTRGVTRRVWCFQRRGQDSEGRKCCVLKRQSYQTEI